MIREEYDRLENLQGAILIGEIPFARASSNWASSDPPALCDSFYMDLDGEWLDTDGDGVYDGHGPGSGDRGPEIWVGRLYASTVKLYGKSELALYKAYFQRNHLYRTGALPRTYKALHFSNNPSGHVPLELEHQTALYPDITLVDAYDLDGDGHPTASEAADMLGRELAGPYEWAHITAHAWSYGWCTNDPEGEWACLGTLDIKEIAPRVLFYNTHSCGTARFIDRDYLAGVCLFSDHGLGYLGFTTSGYYPPEWDAIYSASLRDRTFGEAFKAIYEHVFDIFPTETAISWTGQEMIFLGDPTLRIYFEDPGQSNSPPSTPNLPDGPASGTVGQQLDFGFYATDPDGDLLHLVVDWGDGTTDETEEAPSGSWVAAAHVWEKAGTYSIRAHAVDQYGLASEWSPVHTLTVEAGGGRELVISDQPISTWYLGSSAYRSRQAQLFKAIGSRITGASVSLVRIAASSASALAPIQVSIRQSLNGTVLASGQILPSQVASTAPYSPQWATVHFVSPASVKEGSYYYLVLEVGQPDPANYYRVGFSRDVYRYGWWYLGSARRDLDMACSITFGG